MTKYPTREQERTLNSLCLRFRGLLREGQLREENEKKWEKARRLKTLKKAR